MDEMVTENMLNKIVELLDDPRRDNAEMAA